MNRSRLLLLAAILLGIVNGLVRPLVVILTLPITVVTLGLFLLVINALILLLVAERARMANPVTEVSEFRESWQELGGDGGIKVCLISP